MITFALVNQASLNKSEMDKLVIKTQFFLDGFCDDWEIDRVRVNSVGNFNTRNMYIGTTGRIRGIGAYHKTISNTPAAFCLPYTAYDRFGIYHPGRTWRGKVIWKESFRPGLLTNICHEAAEMMVDPYNSEYSPPDKLGRHWRKEICDHVFGQYFTDSDKCVYPDYALPAFYELNGVKPFNRNNTIPASFTLSAKGYGYWLNNAVLEKLR